MTTTRQPVRLMQAGLGGWGQDWARHVLRPAEERGDLALVASVDADAATLARAQATLGLPPERCFADLGEALEAVEVDAVLITASLAGHVPLALAALAAGKHVLIEKPFAPTVAEARQVVAAAERNGCALMVSQNYRFYPAVAAVRALIAERALGEVGSVSLDFRKYANRAAREGHRHYTLRQPLLMDMAIHHFDLMRSVLGQEAREIACRAFNPPWSNFDEPAAAVATIAFDGGAVLSYRGSWVSPGPPTLWGGEWRVECSGGEIIWTSRADTGTDADRVTIRPLGKRARHLNLPPMEHYDRAGSLEAFLAAVRTGVEPPSSGRDNLGSIALMNAAVESATSGLPLPVPGS